MFLIVFREDTGSPWEPFPYFIKTLPEAQIKCYNYSRGSHHQYDIWSCESITNRMCKDMDCVTPEIVKERNETDK